MGIKHDVDTGKTTNKQTERLVDIHLLFLFVIRQTRRHSHFTDLTFRFELPAQAHKRMEVARTKWDTFAPRHNLNQFPFDWFFFFFFPIHFIFLHFSMITNLRDLAQMTVFSIPLCQYERKTKSNEQIKKNGQSIWFDAPTTTNRISINMKMMIRRREHVNKYGKTLGMETTEKNSFETYAGQIFQRNWSKSQETEQCSFWFESLSINFACQLYNVCESSLPRIWLLLYWKNWIERFLPAHIFNDYSAFSNVCSFNRKIISLPSAIFQISIHWHWLL